MPAVEPWRVGVSEWTLREPTTRRALGRTRAAGFDAVELLATPDTDIATNRRLLDDLGLAALAICPVYGSSRRFGSAEPAERRAAGDLLRHSIDYARAVGADVVIVVPDDSPLPLPGSVADALQRSAEAIGEVAAGMGAGGPVLVIEPLNRSETALVTTIRQALDLCSAIGSDRVAVMADTFHLDVEEGAPRQALRGAGEVLRHVHLADHHRREPGTGRIDFRGVFTDLAGLDYRGSLVIEAIPTTDEGLAAGRRYVEALLEEVGCR